MRISTHAPAGEATGRGPGCGGTVHHFYSRPCGRGDGPSRRSGAFRDDFYSRPCGRGDALGPENRFAACHISTHAPAGGATPPSPNLFRRFSISTHAPAGGATMGYSALLPFRMDFYSRPCGRGDGNGGGTGMRKKISTHAPAGGATAIFHKSVMRFCGKLPKDDTVLCLASFGFPRRDPKAVYLAWISCANLPQKCVREGLALKDQGTSCFHEGLASHAFDPVLV